MILNRGTTYASETLDYLIRWQVKQYHAEDWKVRAVTNRTTERGTYTVDEAAERLGIGRNAAYEAIKRGELPALRIGRRIVIPRAALERLLSDPLSAA